MSCAIGCLTIHDLNGEISVRADCSVCPAMMSTSSQQERSPGSTRTSASQPTTIHRSGRSVGVKSRFATDVARETPSGTCSERGADTSNRPCSRTARRPCPRRNAPRRQRADTGPGPTEPSATPCHVLAFRGSPMTEYGPDRNPLGVLSTGQPRSGLDDVWIGGDAVTGVTGIVHRSASLVSWAVPAASRSFVRRRTCRPT
jgi:hypothetical protein